MSILFFCCCFKQIFNMTHRTAAVAPDFVDSSEDNDEDEDVEFVECAESVLSDSM